jgi:hypothetical protein
MKIKYLLTLLVCAALIPMNAIAAKRNRKPLKKPVRISERLNKTTRIHTVNNPVVNMVKIHHKFKKGGNIIIRIGDFDKDFKSDYIRVTHNCGPCYKGGQRQKFFYRGKKTLHRMRSKYGGEWFPLVYKKRAKTYKKNVIVYPGRMHHVIMGPAKHTRVKSIFRLSDKLFKVWKDADETKKQKYFEKYLKNITKAADYKLNYDIK